MTEGRCACGAQLIVAKDGKPTCPVMEAEVDAYIEERVSTFGRHATPSDGGIGPD